MENSLKTKLQFLAQKYETASFTTADPSQFLRRYSQDQIADVECASFIAAMLAFGNRKQFIPKIQQLLQTADATSGSITRWLLAGTPDFPTGEKKFYRFYSYDDMHCLFNELAHLLHQAPTLGDFFKTIYEGGESLPLILSTAKAVSSRGGVGGGSLPLACTSLQATPSSGVSALTSCNLTSINGNSISQTTPQRPGIPVTLDQIISAAFPESAIVPKGKNSANKRIHMFLRWMVRDNSPVDLGIWNWYPKSELLIPLDVHVMEESIKLGLLPENSKASRKTAVQLSAQLAEAFPGDPARGDFALFGLGVDEG